MWPLYRLGIVLPGCGLTRGVVAAARGDLAGAWRWNPASLLVVLGGRRRVARAGVGRTTGWWLSVRVAPCAWLVGLGLAALVLLWVTSGLTLSC